MKIRKAITADIDGLVALDRVAYGDDGASKGYFLEKFLKANTTVLVVEGKEALKGFAVIETYHNNTVPAGFSSMGARNLPLKWLFIAAFTTKTNYKDKKEDSLLLDQIEKDAKIEGCTACLVPLSKDHPYEKHEVFDFWEGHGYVKCGEISWISNSGEMIECFLLKKDLV